MKIAVRFLKAGCNELINQPGIHQQSLPEPKYAADHG
jgi:hypothetical protein